MASKWEVKSLGDILEVNPTLKLPKGTEAKKVAMEYIAEFTKKIQGYEITPFTSGSKFQNGDTLMARITPCLENGKTAFVDILEQGEVAFGSTEYFVLRAKEGIADSQFIYYLSISDEVRTVAIKSMTGTSGRQRAQKEALLEYQRPIPSLDIQKRIGNLLSLFDKKIEVNKEIIKNLEQLSETIFKRWFIDFEFPNEEGLPYSSSGGGMIESEVGLIPTEFYFESLENIALVIDNRGKTPPLVDFSDYPIIDVKALGGDSRVIDYTQCRKYVDEQTYNSWFRKGHPQQFDLLLSTVGSIGEMKLFYENKGCIAQNVVAFRVDKSLSIYFYEYMKYIKKDLISFNIGTVQPSIKITHINKIKMVIPNAKILDKYNEFIMPINEKIFSLSAEIGCLKNNRDTLLPKLLSGEIEIPDESVVES